METSGSVRIETLREDPGNPRAGASRAPGPGPQVTPSVTACRIAHRAAARRAREPAPHGCRQVRPDPAPPPPDRGVPARHVACFVPPRGGNARSRRTHPRPRHRRHDAGAHPPQRGAAAGPMGANRRARRHRRDPAAHAARPRPRDAARDHDGAGRAAVDLGRADRGRDRPLRRRGRPRDPARGWPPSGRWGRSAAPSSSRSTGRDASLDLRASYLGILQRHEDLRLHLVDASRMQACLRDTFERCGQAVHVAGLLARLANPLDRYLREHSAERVARDLDELAARVATAGDPAAVAAYRRAAAARGRQLGTLLEIQSLRDPDPRPARAGQRVARLGHRRGGQAAGARSRAESSWPAVDGRRARRAGRRADRARDDDGRRRRRRAARPRPRPRHASRRLRGGAARRGRASATQRRSGCGTGEAAGSRRLRAPGRAGRPWRGTPAASSSSGSLGGDMPTTRSALWIVILGGQDRRPRRRRARVDRPRRDPARAARPRPGHRPARRRRDPATGRVVPRRRARRPARRPRHRPGRAAVAVTRIQARDADARVVFLPGSRRLARAPARSASRSRAGRRARPATGSRASAAPTPWPRRRRRRPCGSSPAATSRPTPPPSRPTPSASASPTSPTPSRPRTWRCRRARSIADLLARAPRRHRDPPAAARRDRRRRPGGGLARAVVSGRRSALDVIHLQPARSPRAPWPARRRRRARARRRGSGASAPLARRARRPQPRQATVIDNIGRPAPPAEGRE